MTQLRWTLQAVEDLTAIRDYIERDSPRYARVVIERILERAEAAVDFPLAGRMVPEFARDDVREVIVGSYRIVYRVQDSSITVLTVFRSSRLFPLENLESAE